MTFKVIIDDNFSPGETYTHGVFDTYTAAAEAATTVVQESLDNIRKNRGEDLAASEIYELYTLFGEDPYIDNKPIDAEPEFNARKAARSILRLPES